MNVDQVFGQIRPITHLIGTIVLVAGALKFFGINVPISGGAVEMAAIGFFIRSI